MANDRRASVSRQGSRRGSRLSIPNDGKGSRANLQSQRGARSSTRRSSSKQNEGVPEDASTEPEPINPQQQAWAMFTDHVKTVSMSDMFLGETKEMYPHLCSDAHKQIVDGLRFQARNLILKTRTVETIEMIKKEATPDEPDDDSDSEDAVDRQRKRATARQHWGIIRRYVQDRIKQRKRNKGGWNKEKAFNRLRAQAKITLKPEQVRQELFIKYGIIPKPGRAYPEDIMKPVSSARAKDIIARFEQIQVPNLRDRPKSMAYGNTDSYRMRSSRPRTIHTYVKPLSL